MWSEVGADAYGRFMGRYADPLAERFVELVGVEDGQRALDVGCGPGTLTVRLVERWGASAVAGVDPSPSFVDTARRRCPGVDLREGTAEDLPFADDAFDLVLAQLVVHFMTDPVAGLREMGRVARPGGRVGACVWDERETGPLAVFWSAAESLTPRIGADEPRAGTTAGDLAALCAQAGLAVEHDGRLEVAVAYASFDEWWTPYTLGVGPAGAHVAQLDPSERDRLRSACAERLPEGPFEVVAGAWVVLARA